MWTSEFNAWVGGLTLWWTCIPSRWDRDLTFTLKACYLTSWTILLFLQIKDLPAELTSRQSLATFLTRFLFHISVHHAAINYPLADYGTFTLNMPTKLYRDSRVADDKFSLFNFPNGNISAVSVWNYKLFTQSHFTLSFTGEVEERFSFISYLLRNNLTFLQIEVFIKLIERENNITTLPSLRFLNHFIRSRG